MLISTRRPGRTLVIETNDGPAEVVVHKIAGQQAKTGIEASDSVKMLRDELADLATPRTA